MQVTLALAVLVGGCDTSGTDNVEQAVDTSSTTAIVTTTTVVIGAPMVPSNYPNSYLTTVASGGPFPECPELPPGVFITPAPTAMYLDWIDAWYEVPISAVSGAMADSGRDDESPQFMKLGSERSGAMAEVIEAGSLVAQRAYPGGPFEQWIYDPAFDELVGDEADGLALFGLEGRDPDTAMITRIVMRTSDGGFNLSGACRSTRQLLSVAAYAGEVQAGAYETFRAIASDDAELEAFGAWIRLSIASR